MSEVVPTVVGSAPTSRPDPRPSRRPRPSGDLRRRVLRHYLPLALVSGLVLVVFMNLPFFDANRYPPPGDLFSEGIKGAYPSGSVAFPGGGQPGSPTGHGGGGPRTPPTAPGGGQPGGLFDHGGGGAPPFDHGGSQPGTPPTDAGGEVGTPHMQSGSQSRASAAGFWSAPSMRRFSTATGYVALGLLGLALLIGPANLLRRRRIPVSSYLRRDVGIWTAIASVVHVVFGLLVKHGDGILAYFFESGDRSRLLTSSFGLANWAGLGATVIVAGLAAVSSDAALRKLKARRWKQIQRLSYLLFALVIVHALLYGALWREISPYTILLGLSFLAVLAGQAMGVRLWRQRNARTTAAATA